MLILSSHETTNGKRNHILEKKKKEKDVIRPHRTVLLLQTVWLIKAFICSFLWTVSALIIILVIYILRQVCLAWTSLCMWIYISGEAFVSWSDHCHTPRSSLPSPSKVLELLELIKHKTHIFKLLVGIRYLYVLMPDSLDSFGVHCNWLSGPIPHMWLTISIENYQYFSRIFLLPIL